MSRSSSQDQELTPEFVEATVHAVARAFEDNYVDTTIALRMGQHLRARLAEGAFAKPASLGALAHAMQSELRSVQDDRHVYVIVRRGEEVSSADSTCENAMYAAHAKDNFGFRRVEVLPGTVGYLDVRFFCPAPVAGATAAAAMNFLAGTNALIFDLRKHGGGSDSMVRFLAGYLFDESVELCSIHHRGERGIEQSRSSDYVPGRRLSHLPVYVLTSSITMSAAEDFAYNLQQRGRATIVGETTRGGGHTVMFVRLPEFELELGIPEGKAVNPISKAGWEGCGVVPDLAVPAESALTVAHRHALQRLKETLHDPDVLFLVDWALARLCALCEPVSVDEETLILYAGSYGRSNRVRVEDGVLYVKHEGYPEAACTPLSRDLFEYDGGSSRAKFVREKGRVTQAIFSLEDGSIFPVKRT